MKCLSLKQKGITLSQTFAVTVQVYCDLSVILLVAAVCSDKKNVPIISANVIYEHTLCSLVDFQRQVKILQTSLYGGTLGVEHEGG